MTVNFSDARRFLNVVFALKTSGAEFYEKSSLLNFVEGEVLRSSSYFCF